MLKVSNHKLVIVASAAIIAIPVMAALANQVSVEATANFRTGIAITKTADLDFATIDYSTSTVTGSDTVTLNPQTGGRSFAGGNFTAAVGSGAGTPSAGNVLVNQADNLNASVFCSTTATLKTVSQANSIQVTNVTFWTGTGSPVSCAGITTGAGSFTLTGGTNADHIKIGGTLDGGQAGGSIVSGAYSTTNSGTPIQVDLIYD